MEDEYFMDRYSWDAGKEVLKVHAYATNGSEIDIEITNPTVNQVLDIMHVYDQRYAEKDTLIKLSGGNAYVR